LRLWETSNRPAKPLSGELAENFSKEFSTPLPGEELLTDRTVTGESSDSVN
jgi:hypothetical protein